MGFSDKGLVYDYFFKLFIINEISNTPMQMKLLMRPRGFTMAKMLATVGMVGILGAVSITLILGSQDSVRTQRLV